MGLFSDNFSKKFVNLVMVAITRIFQSRGDTKSVWLRKYGVVTIFVYIVQIGTLL